MVPMGFQLHYVCEPYRVTAYTVVYSQNKHWENRTEQITFLSMHGMEALRLLSHEYCSEILISQQVFVRGE